jgi:hypothetical protein
MTEVKSYFCDKNMEQSTVEVTAISSFVAHNCNRIFVVRLMLKRT